MSTVDLIEFRKLERENKRLNKIIEDIEDWAVVSFDEKLLKLIDTLKKGERRV